MTAAARLLYYRSNARLPRHRRRPIMTLILTLRYSARRKSPRSTKGHGEIAGPASRGRDQPQGSGDSLSQPVSLLASICHYFQQNSVIHSFHRIFPQHTYVSRTHVIVSPPYLVGILRNTSQHILSFLRTYLYTNITWQNLLTCLINCRVVSSGTPELGC